MFPETGSTMMQAISPGYASNIARTEARSLYSAFKVSAAVPGVTPGLEGSPRVAAPEPASTRKLSAWPW